MRVSSLRDWREPPLGPPLGPPDVVPGATDRDSLPFGLGVGPVGVRRVGRVFGASPCPGTNGHMDDLSTHRDSCMRPSSRARAADDATLGLCCRPVGTYPLAAWSGSNCSSRRPERSRQPSTSQRCNSSVLRTNLSPFSTESTAVYELR